MSKSQKTEVNYSRGMLHSHCGPMFPDDRHYCRYSIRFGACEKVEGPIDPQYWCELFHRVAEA